MASFYAQSEASNLVDIPDYRRPRWTRYEDTKLREHIATHGPTMWRICAEGLPGRTPESCRTRWANQLNPNIKKTAFSEDEERVLIDAHRRHGNCWKRISNELPGRTAICVRNRMRCLLARKRRSQPAQVVQLVPISPQPTSVYEHRTLMAKGGTSMASTFLFHSSPSVIPSLNFNINRSVSSNTRPAAVSTPQPPPPPPPPALNLSLSPPSSLNFIDFLGVGTV